MFDLSPEELLEPVEVAQSRALQRLVRARDAQARRLRTEAEKFEELAQRLMAECEALGQTIPAGDVDLRVVDTENGRHLTIEMRRVRS